MTYYIVKAKNNYKFTFDTYKAAWDYAKIDGNYSPVYRVEETLVDHEEEIKAEKDILIDQVLDSKFDYVSKLAALVAHKIEYYLVPDSTFARDLNDKYGISYSNTINAAELAYERGMITEKDKVSFINHVREVFE